METAGKGCLWTIIFVVVVSFLWNIWGEDFMWDYESSKRKREDKAREEVFYNALNSYDFEKARREATTDEKLETVFLAESQFLIAHIEEKDAVDRIVYLITSNPVRGENPGDGEIVSWSDVEGYNPKYGKYASWVSKNNSRCDQLLMLAIGIHHEELANRILWLYREKIEFEELEGNKYKVHKSQEARDHARKLYKEAFGRSTWNEDAQDILLDIKEQEEQSEDQQEEDSDILKELPVVTEY